MRWPALTLLGIALAVIVGMIHALVEEFRPALRSCLLGYDDIGPISPRSYDDPSGPDGYDPFASREYGPPR